MLDMFLHEQQIFHIIIPLFSPMCHTHTITKNNSTLYEITYVIRDEIEKIIAAFLFSINVRAIK